MERGAKRSEKDRNMDVNLHDLTPMEAASWWREDGYETLDEGGGSEDEDEDEETDS
jgi:hypothetical protein